MNRMLATIFLTLAAPLVIAGTPRVDARQEHQDDRIEQGAASGELTEREQAKLDAQQQHIENKEDRAKADGVVTPRERASLQRSENRASRNIRRQKHDRQDQH